MFWLAIFYNQYWLNTLRQWFFNYRIIGIVVRTDFMAHKCPWYVSCLCFFISFSIEKNKTIKMSHKLTILLKRKKQRRCNMVKSFGCKHLPWALKMRCIQLAYLHQWCRIVDVLMLLWADPWGTPKQLLISHENQPHLLCICICRLFQTRRLLLNLAKHQRPVTNDRMPMK